MKITHTELFLYLADELSADERVEFEKALAQSPEAQQTLAELQEQERLLARLPLQEPRRDLVAAALGEVRPKRVRRVRFPSPWLAAAAALLLLAGGIFWMLGTGDNQTRMAKIPTPVPPPIGDQELEARIARLRRDMKAPTHRPREMPSPPHTSPSLVAGIQTRLQDLRDRCRPQMAAIHPAKTSSPLDRRMRHLRNKMGTVREDIWLMEVPSEDQAAGRRLEPRLLLAPISTIISPLRRYTQLEGIPTPNGFDSSSIQMERKKQS